MSYFNNYPAAAEKWSAGSKIVPSEVREGLDKGSVREPKEALAEIYRVYSLFSHVNRQTVWNRLLGEDNHLTVGAQGNVAEDTVGAVLREIMLLMMWFVDVFYFVFKDVASKMDIRDLKATIAYRDLVQVAVKRLKPLL